MLHPGSKAVRLPLPHPPRGGGKSNFWTAKSPGEIPGPMSRLWKILLLLAGIVLLALLEIRLIDRRRSAGPPSPGKTTPPGSLLQHGGQVIRKGDLLWLRCPPGTSQAEAGCRGKARLYSWSTALQFCRNLRVQNLSGWRLPALRELAELRHCDSRDPRRCRDPAKLTQEQRQRCRPIYARRRDVFWSAQGPRNCVDGSSGQSRKKRCAWSVLFYSGRCGAFDAREGLRPLGKKALVRCVRTAP